VRRALAAAIVATVVLLDQVTKYWATKTLSGAPPVAVFESWFHLVHHRNTGGVFGLFAGPPSTGRTLFFLVATAAALVFILHLMKEWGRRSAAALCGLSLIAGGALGNLIDRIARGEVIDFIDWHWRRHHWPAFNVADSAITAGSLLLVSVILIHGERLGRKGE